MDDECYGGCYTNHAGIRPPRVQLLFMFAFSEPDRRVALHLATSFLLLIPIFAAAQVSISVEGQPVPDSPERFLKAHHVSTTKDGLITGLQNVDPEVRKVAVDVLSRRWTRDAKAPLEIAMLRRRRATRVSVFAQVRSLHRLHIHRRIRRDRNVLSSGRATNERTPVRVWGLGVALINECCPAGYFHLRFNKEMSE